MGGLVSVSFRGGLAYQMWGCVPPVTDGMLVITPEDFVRRGYVSRNVGRLVWGMLFLAVACGFPLDARGQRVETPAASAFGLQVDDDSRVMFGVAEPLPGAGDSLRIGFAVSCEKSSRKLEAVMSFGSVPSGKPVQAAVRTADGRVERFGPVFRGGGPAAGFFDPKVEDEPDVLRLIDAAFAPGSLVSNGHNSVWNRIGADKNREARIALRRCAGAGE